MVGGARLLAHLLLGCFTRQPPCRARKEVCVPNSRLKGRMETRDSVGRQVFHNRVPPETIFYRARI